MGDAADNRNLCYSRRAIVFLVTVQHGVAHAPLPILAHLFDAWPQVVGRQLSGQQPRNVLHLSIGARRLKSNFPKWKIGNIFGDTGKTF